MVASRQRHWRSAEVRALIDETRPSPRYELVAGELLVTPSPGPQHQEAVALLLGALRDYLRSEPVAHALDSPSDVELEADDLRQPDVYVMPAAEWQRVRREGFPVRELLVAAEVVSASTGRYDRVTKRPGYQRHVPEYWIVDVDARLVERWRPADERPEILTERLVWRPAGTRSAFDLDLSEFFHTIWDR